MKPRLTLLKEQKVIAEGLEKLDLQDHPNPLQLWLIIKDLKNGHPIKDKYRFIFSGSNKYSELIWEGKAKQVKINCLHLLQEYGISIHRSNEPSLSFACL